MIRQAYTKYERAIFVTREKPERRFAMARFVKESQARRREKHRAYQQREEKRRQAQE